jgi:hypothetical protein
VSGILARLWVIDPYGVPASAGEVWLSSPMPEYRRPVVIPLDLRWARVLDASGPTLIVETYKRSPERNADGSFDYVFRVLDETRGGADSRGGGE